MPRMASFPQLSLRSRRRRTPLRAAPRSGWVLAIAVAALLALVEAVLVAADAGAFGPRPWRLLAYGYGAFWSGLLGDWQPNFPLEPVTMFATYAFLHADAWHLAGNVLTILYLLPLLAARIGTGRTALAYAAAIPGGAAGFALLAWSVQPMVGASGAVFGLAGAFLQAEHSGRRRAGHDTGPVWRAMLALSALNLVLWWAMDGLLAWQTHLGGFAAGWAAAALSDPARARGRQGRRRSAAALAGLAALVAALLLVPRLAAAEGAPVPAAAGASGAEGAAAALPESWTVRPDGTLVLPDGARGAPPRPVDASALADRPALGPAPDGAEGPAVRRSPEGRGYARLRALLEDGAAAGNLGDLYENRDGLHSLPDLDRFPRIARVVREDGQGRVRPKGRSGPAYGLAGPLPWRAPTVGNASVAMTGGAFWRSMPRAAMTLDPEALAAAAAGYGANRLYVYPEHRDHDARGRHPGAGYDLLPANLPYWIVTQGSSGSDRAALEALMAILAALRPDTKDLLVREGLVAPALQALFRKGAMPRGADWRAPAAHPAVFDRRALDLDRMIAAAAALAPEAVPPAVRLAVLLEDRFEPPPGPDGPDGTGGPGEALHDGAHAIARVWRSEAGRRSMTVSAAATKAPDGRALAFDWVLLRGDPGLVGIEPLDERGSRARITVDWQAPRPGPGGLLAPRVEIGVFARDGGEPPGGVPLADGMPGLISILLPAHESRRYDPPPGGAADPVLREIDRLAGTGVYADPALWPEAYPAR